MEVPPSLQPRHVVHHVVNPLCVQSLFCQPAAQRASCSAARASGLSCSASNDVTNCINSTFAYTGLCERR